MSERAIPTPLATLIVLGAGYTGRVLFRQARAEGRIVFAASRTPDTSLMDIPPEQRLRFDLDRDDTWDAVPPKADAVWTFPAVPPDTVRAFGEQVVPRLRRLVVLGATSAYDGSPQAVRGEPVEETAPVDRTIARVQGEELLRERYGAIVLRVAGIYGPGRNPLDWIRQGRVGYSHRYVNLIHVEDLAAVILRSLEDGTPGDTYNVSDGTPRRWSEIMDAAAARWGTAKPLPADPTAGKRISNRKLLAEFGYTLRYPDLYKALEELERNT
jgi:nucleoside-diphosphate-sugar epimerase